MALTAPVKEAATSAQVTRQKTIGYAATAADAALAPFSFERREVLPRDVQIEILFCGVCHSDLHTARNEWQNTIYPVVPGHEIVGRITKAGSEVTKFKEGGLAGVGCMVDSCRTCPSCKDGLEQYCIPGFTGTYNSDDKILGGVTYGGYSKTIVVNEDFVLRLPENLDLAAVAPLLCAGITTYSPLRHWKVGKGQKVGIVGLGGLGHMGVKLANAMGAHAVLFTTSANKKEDGKRLGAAEVVVSRNQAEMDKHLDSFDFILDTVSAAHDINAYLNLLKRDATLTQVGAPEVLNVSPFSLIFRRRQLAGSLIGGIAETQEMLDFCGEHGITSDIEIIPIRKINEAYERMLKSDVKYRFVIDMGSLG
ncbi:MAG: hydroxyacid dehydrogenase [Acidobacteriales bacterium]|nr:hydroxyacid dehydrogenase [Terriglobales bacterium]